MFIDALAQHDRRIDICQYVLMTPTSPGTEAPVDAPLCCPPLTGDVLAEDEAVELASLVKSLADPVRLRLISIIAASEAGEVCACDFPALVDRSQATVSHHLGILVKAGLLDREQRGKWAWFRLRSDRLDDLSASLRGSERTPA